MSLENWIIVSNSHHALYERVKDLPNFVTLQDALDNGTQLNDKNVVDLTLLPTAQKEYWLEEMEHHQVGRVLCELGAYWVPKFIRNYPIISSSFSTCFFSPKQAFEVCPEIPGDDELFDELGEMLKLNPIEVTVPDLSFTYGQIVSMIINEAFFALEEDLASPEDIDKAMLFGVNYPIGPMELLKKSSPMAVVNLLDELFGATGNPRYRVSPHLRLHQ